MMKTLREYIMEAKHNGVAVGHFNISNLEAFHGICNAAKELNLPVIIGVSEGEESFVGIDEAVALVKMKREVENQAVFLNADHHYSFESVKKCIDAGFDAVIIDAVKLPLDENIALTKKCVDYAREVSIKENRDILVEAEIGFIGTSSKILDKIPDGVGEDTMTKVEDAVHFVKETGVDMLAPSVGNVHGMITTGNPRLHPELVLQISQATGIPLVLHGGSGTMNEDFTACIKNGICLVHINTEIRKAYKEGLENYLKEHPEEIAPYKYLKPAEEAIERVVSERLKLFNHIV